MDNLTLVAVLSVSIGSVAALLGFAAVRTLASKPGTFILNVERTKASSAANVAAAALNAESGNATASFGSRRLEQAASGRAIGAKA
jgi:hypothetical protein